MTVRAPVAAETTVNNVATEIVPTARGRLVVVILNNEAAGGDVLYVGPSNVSTADGLPIPPQSSLTLDGYQGALYGIGAGAAVNIPVRVLQVYGGGGI